MIAAARIGDASVLTSQRIQRFARPSLSRAERMKNLRVANYNGRSSEIASLTPGKKSGAGAKGGDFQVVC